jgi:D-aminoacyl-tRNA deacylase
MRVVLQKVKNSSVKVKQETVGEISHGFLLLLGITHEDTEKQADWLVEKILKLRLFSDNNSDSFMDKNIEEVGGSILVVSQFTLYGECKKGTRPSFTKASRSDHAEPLYNYFVKKLEESGIKTEIGVFGAKMDVELVNNGPITLILEK